MSVMPRALVVDDDSNFREGLAELVHREGFTVETAGSLAEARPKVAEDPPDVVLMDLGLPDGEGVELLDAPPPGSRTEFIVITGLASVESVINALRSGVLDYLTKPVDIPRLKSVLANLTRTAELKVEIGSLRKQLRELGRFGRLIGSSPAMQRVYDLIARVAPTNASVLLTGESGTGKELVAQTIHELSRRRRGPFLPLNCGAMPAGLVESELFGHERGSFTGATQLRRGHFERASNGTLMLDEIAEMPIELQVKLLRVLETGMAIRVGGDTAVQVDARVIAATNRSPEQAVADGKMREDLLYRLNVFPIELPPLRERGNDVELLAAFFLEDLNRTENMSKRFAPGALTSLRSHAWPGNVRELKNVVQRAFILAEDELVPELPGEGRVVEAGAAATTSGAASPRGTLADIERKVILSTLQRNGGDKRRTAAELGISLKTLYNRLKAYGGSPSTPSPAPEPAGEEEPEEGEEASLLHDAGREG
jgi:two-component system, NtrC family, response regulator AtoC